MADHASKYVDEDDSPTAGLLKVLRAYGSDTSEARLASDDARTTGRVPLPGRGGRLPAKLERLAHELGWATERDGGFLLVERGEGVDVARDSLLPLTRRTSTDMQKRTFGVDNWTQPGARTLVDGREGEMARAEDLEAGDTVFVEYREMRRGGGYSYSASAQQYTATVEATSEDAVDLGDSGTLDLTSEYEGRATWTTPEGDTRAVKHLVRLD